MKLPTKIIFLRWLITSLKKTLNRRIILRQNNNLQDKILLINNFSKLILKGGSSKILIYSSAKR